MPFGLRPIHLVVIVIVALIVFGPKRLPQIGRWLGKTFSEFRKGARDMADGFKEESTPQNTGGVGTATSEQDSNPSQPAQPSPHPEASAGHFCTTCGTQNTADARFCNKCGTRLPV
jgi:sec-independent protein translocase protein TatA